MELLLGLLGLLAGEPHSRGAFRGMGLALLAWTAGRIEGNRGEIEGNRGEIEGKWTDGPAGRLAD
ncbi:hypothetical protein ABZV75_29300 [Streptomyces flaveolus]|uniref:hypothetical protein n=1 Tax=Streptomyces flaveolus TaxID=67297 RepID=UPI0033B9C933